LIGAIGRQPRLGFLASALKSKVEQLEAEGLLHFAGDIWHGLFRQTSIAVGDGMLAAMKIYYLSGYDVIVSVGEVEENYIGSNRGQYITRPIASGYPLTEGYTYHVEKHYPLV
jgi:hypothetical protein